MTKVAVVILNWNGEKFLKAFLPSVIEHSKNIAEVIVADNCSEDGSVSFLQTYYPEIQIITNRENGGFSKGYNDALKQVEAEYYVLLNSDIEVTQNWIEPIIELMDSDNSIAVCQPKLRAYHQQTHFEYAGAAGGFIDRFGYPFCRGRIFQHLEEDHGQFNDACEVFWATGAAMFVRSELYHKYGGLDEDFFAHMEEIDFCWRMKNEGYKIMYCPQSTVFHVGGGTLPKSSSRKTYLNFRNNFSLLLKNLPAHQIIPVFAFRLAFDAIAGIKFMIDGGVDDLFAVIKGHFAFYRLIPTMWKKRKTIQHRKVSCIYQRSIVLEHYVEKKKRFLELQKEAFTKDQA